ncbi:MAG: VOC family protein [Acidimicrobiia bacterium]
MKLMPIVYVTDMGRSTAFYQGLVPNGTLVSQSPYWTEFNVGGSALALHYTDSLPSEGLWVELALVAFEPLEEVVEHLRLAGIEPDRGIQDEAFGRSLVVRDPDGLPIQINQHEDEVYPG